MSTAPKSKPQHWYVYVITHVPSGRKYVGKTNHPARRWYAHRYAARRQPNTHISSAIRKYGVEQFTFEVIEEHSKERDAYDAERRWIARLDTRRSGFNRTDGGDGGARPDLGEILRLRWAQKQDAEEDRTGLRSTILSEILADNEQWWHLHERELSRTKYDRAWVERLIPSPPRWP